MGFAQQIRTHYTYADYLRWPADERYELIEGQPYAMAPAPTVAHQVIVGELHFQLRGALAGHACLALVAPVDVLLPRPGDADDLVDTVLQPDVLVVCDRSKVREKHVRGAPDWVLEVLSPGSAGRDTVTKRRLYEEAGVREFWLVHPIDRVLTAYTLGADGLYGRPHLQLLEGQTPVAVLPGVVIDWDLLDLPAEDAGP